MVSYLSLRVSSFVLAGDGSLKDSNFVWLLNSLSLRSVCRIFAYISCLTAFSYPVLKRSLSTPFFYNGYLVCT